MNEKLTDLELEAVHLRGRVAELERIVKAQEDELGHLRGHDGELSEREWRILDMWPRFEDNEPVMVGDKALDKSGETFTVCRIDYKAHTWLLNDSVTEGHYLKGDWRKRVKRPAPEGLTHREPDSWEKLVEDAAKGMFGYWKCFGTPCEECPSRIDGETPATYYGITSCLKAKQLDVIRRAKKLAGVE